MKPNELLLKLQEEHYNGYITAEELVRERKRAQEETKHRLLEKYRENSTPEDLTQYKEDIERHHHS